MHRVRVSVRMVVVLAGLAPLTLFPAVEASSVQPPPILAEADPGTTLAVTPLADRRPALFVRHLGADGATGRWRLVAIDAHAPYEFHAAAVSEPGGGQSLIFRAAEKKGPEFR